jgi:tRNA 2-thiocytidine biosynthesis protein TtcA
VTRTGDFIDYSLVNAVVVAQNDADCPCSGWKRQVLGPVEDRDMSPPLTNAVAIMAFDFCVSTRCLLLSRAARWSEWAATVLEISQDESGRADPRKGRLEFNKLRKRLRRQVGKAIADFELIEPGDRVMVCISGGKDSHAMLEILMALRDSAPIDFEIVAVTLDQKQPGYPEEVLPGYLETLNIPFYILERDTYSVVRSVIPEGKTTCGLCSRLRRGTLYGFADQIGASKIALGHHRDDIVETLFLNLFFGGKLKAMPAKLKSDDGRHIVIRPLAYCKESDLERYASDMQFPIVPCNLCGTQENLQRQEIKKMLREWERGYPGRTETIFRALGNVAPSHLLDRALFDFEGLAVEVDASLGLPEIGVVNL